LTLPALVQTETAKLPPEIVRRTGESAGRRALSETIRVLIADDHPLMLGALRQAVLGATPGAEVLEASDYDSLVRALAAQLEIDLVLLDLTMPGVRGYSGLMYLRAERPELPVIVVSASDDGAIMSHCLEFGAAAFIPKSLSAEAMRKAIRAVLEGGQWTPDDAAPVGSRSRESSAVVRRLASLTPQQVRVLMMLSQGLLNKQIAYELGVSEATVKAHVSAILQKLGVESRTQAVILAGKVERAQDLG
jgi:DNA-binding NarL/FixJ family response regulator